MTLKSHLHAEGADLQLSLSPVMLHGGGSGSCPLESLSSCAPLCNVKEFETFVVLYCKRELREVYATWLSTNYCPENQSTRTFQLRESCGTRWVCHPARRGVVSSLASIRASPQPPLPRSDSLLQQYCQTSVILPVDLVPPAICSLGQAGMVCPTSCALARTCTYSHVASLSTCTAERAERQVQPRNTLFSPALSSLTWPMTLVTGPVHLCRSQSLCSVAYQHSIASIRIQPDVCMWETLQTSPVAGRFCTIFRFLRPCIALLLRPHLISPCTLFTQINTGLATVTICGRRCSIPARARSSGRLGDGRYHYTWSALLAHHELHTLRRHASQEYFMREVGLTVDPEKVTLGCNKVKFLGHLLCEGDLMIDPDRVIPIFYTLQDGKGVKKLLGIMGYLLHLPDYSKQLALGTVLSQWTELGLATIDFGSRSLSEERDFSLDFQLEEICLIHRTLGVRLVHGQLGPDLVLTSQFSFGDPQPTITLAHAKIDDLTEVHKSTAFTRKED
ncbi:hypothetical protein PR048_008959 [Dryococelus australis]|uniref:Uncharacterized protein n=1 Tax=Dryococelus australis TaxID=614101 RepID=A0ABQ9HYK0_9NEOP|nr:hypothetical protein PR048_008959 [Dryococelus australis]